MVRDRDLTMTFAVPPEPVVVLGDAIQLERVLLNLLSNAMKFTPDGGRVTTTLATQDGEACLAVADTGIGIPSAEQDALFQKFFRASTPRTSRSRAPGSGCPSSPASWRCTAAGSPSTPSPASAPPSRCGCRGSRPRPGRSG